jgi:nucleoside-diphosphate-sugar epimerase
MPKVLVTGATSFLGGYVVSRLLDAGHEVVACLNPRSTVPAHQKPRYYALGLDEACREVRLDLTDSRVAEELVAAEAPDAVVHMASFGDLNRCLQHPLETFDACALIGLRLLEAVRRSGRRIPFLCHSTDKVYGTNDVPFREAMVLKPSNIYEIAKVAQDQAAQYYGKAHGIPAVVVRCGNYFGGYDYNFTRIVPYTIRQNLLGEEIVLRSTGKFTRDFLYIEDAADLNTFLLERLFESGEGLAGEAFNFSLEVQVSVLELVEKICLLMGRPPRVRVANAATHEIPDMRLDCGKARDALGWRPATSLESGLERTIDFYRAHLARAA